MEREEGELTDEELEDVSDTSSISVVPIILSGKSPSLSTGRAPFRELSLTSVSDVSEEKAPVVKDSKKRSKVSTTTRTREISQDVRRRRCRYRREEKVYNNSRRIIRRIPDRRIARRRTNSIRRQCSKISSSSEDEDYYSQDKRLLKQLREAVRINKSQNLPNCSLRTRLKRMIEPDSQGSKNNSDEDIELEALRDQALQSKLKTDDPLNENTVTNNTSNVTDEDLVQLRLVALQSAVIKKHLNRRKRKEEQQRKLEQEHQNNVAGAEENQEVLKDIENNLNQIDVNSERITETNSNTMTTADSGTNVDEDEDILRAMLLTSISKKIANKKTAKQMNSAHKSIAITNNNFTARTLRKPNEIKKSVPVMPVKRLVINVNSDSDSDCEQTVIKKTNSQNNAKNDLFDKSLSLFLQQARAKSEVDRQSDISKHLPRSQQLEYRRLKRKLQQLSTRKKPISKLKKSFSLSGPDENKKLKLTNTITKKPFVTKSKFVSNITSVNKQGTMKPTISATAMPNTGNVNERQLDSVGRLQMKGKYEELAPLMARVSDARNARDKAQAEVKRLINDLRTARAELTSTHQTYTTLMQQLVKSKSAIDKRLEDQELRKNKLAKLPSVMCTSTPNKTILKELSCDMSGIEQSTIAQQDNSQNQVIPNVQNVEPTCTPNESMNGAGEMMMDIVNEEEERREEEANLLKYTSPLDHMQAARKENPLQVLCPYDLLGVCRDPDCSYRHCSNAMQ